MSREIDWENRSDRGELVEAYKTLSKASGFKSGDKVRVLRKFERWELGSSCSWSSVKEKYVGQVGEIAGIAVDGDIAVYLGDSDFWHFPFFVLELVEPVIETHKITIDGKSTEVSEDAYNEIKNLFE